MADNTQKIADLEEILDSGSTEGQVDGRRVRFASATEIRKRIAELKATDDATTTPQRRPAASTIRLGGGV
jgi:hypothetical protein